MSSEPPVEGRLPDWIIIGSMKAATSSLHRYLAEHPDIAASEPKETDFFLPERYESLGLEWYRQRFAEPPGASIAGESSVNYTKAHEFGGVPERIHLHVPDVKLIYILRDPLRRIESHWVHSVGAGEHRGDFASAIRDLETSRQVQTSRYWMQLEKYLEFFPPEQIKVMSYESLSRHPQAAVSEFLEFVGLDPEWTHPLVGKQIHRSSRKMRPNRLGMLFWEDRDRRRRLRKYLPYLVATPIDDPQWEPRLRAQVEEYLRPEMARVREFSGLDFAEWSI